MAFAKADVSHGESLPLMLRDGVFNVDDNIALLIMTCLAGLIGFISIFMYKNRHLQMRVTAVMMVISLAILITAIVIYYQQINALPDSTEEVSTGLGAPVLSILFGSLANKAIRKDEKLVKSMDRLR